MYKLGVGIIGCGTHVYVEKPLSLGFSENSRGLGLADMAKSIIDGTEHRASGKLAYHVLDIMQAFHDASDEERLIKIKSSCSQPKCRFME